MLISEIKQQQQLWNPDVKWIRLPKGYRKIIQSWLPAKSLVCDKANQTSLGKLFYNQGAATGKLPSCLFTNLAS